MIRNIQYFIGFICLLTIISCKKSLISTEKPITPKNLITKYSMKEIYNEKNTREQELIFAYNLKGELESIAQTYIYYNSNTGNISSKNQSTNFITYNNEGLSAEVKTLNKISDGTESINIEKFVYDADKVSEIRVFYIQNGKETPFNMGNYSFKYNAKGQLISYAIADEERYKYTYVNDIHTSSSFGIISEFNYQTILNPLTDFPNGQKIIISRLIEDAGAMGFGLISKYIPKKVANKTISWEYEATSNEKNFPTKIIRKYNNAVQTITIDYKTF